MRSLLLAAALLAGCAGSGVSRVDDGGTRPALALEFSDTVPVGAERLQCVDLPGPDRAFWLGGWRVQRNNVHHVNAYVRAGASDTEPHACDNDPGDGLLFSVSQSPFEYSLPDGSALLLPPGATLHLNVHELNAGDFEATATAHVELLEADPPERIVSAASVGVGRISVAPGATASVGGTCRMPDGAALVGLQSHAHAHTREVTATLDGAPLYASDDWADPVAVAFDPPRAGASISLSCRIVNDTTATLTKCNSRDTCEMCTLNGWIVATTPWICTL